MGVDWVGAEVTELARAGKYDVALRRLGAAHDALAGSMAGRRDAAAQAGQLPQVLLGIANTSVTASTSENATTSATTKLRITDFFIRDAVGDDFNISVMKMGRLDLICGGAVPASMFRSSVQRPPLETPILANSTTITMTADNLSGAAKRFDGGFTGIDLDGQYDMSSTIRCS